jgi:hypothetical protein
MFLARIRMFQKATLRAGPDDIFALRIAELPTPSTGWGYDEQSTLCSGQTCW